MFGAGIPGWAAEPGAWLLVAALAVGYAVALTRLGPRLGAGGAGGTYGATRLQITSWYLGVLAIWLASDWPIHAVAESSMYSVHMVQHLLISLVGVPLLLLGMPAWLARWLVRPGSAAFGVLRRLSRFLPALIIFNLVLVLTHWPAVVDASLRSGGVHFAVHALIFVASIVVWMPVVSPLPEIPRLAPAPRMGYLFLQSVVPTVPASFLTFGASPLYHFYEGRPHLWGMTDLEDMQLAGLLMKIGAGILLWALIAVIFFRWAANEERSSAPQRSRDLARELSALQSQAPGC